MKKTRTNQEWLRALGASGNEQADAIEDLREYLERAARYSLNRQHAPLFQQAPREIEPLAEDCAQDALIAILDHLAEFRSESQFTTWAYKFAVNIALNAGRRELWKQTSLDQLLEQEIPTAIIQDEHPRADPHRAMLQSEVWETLRDIIARDLTDRQRQVFRAVVFDDVPLDEIARQWGSNRNAIYKMLHDVRRKLKAELKARGYTLDEILGTFSVTT